VSAVIALRSAPIEMPCNSSVIQRSAQPVVKMPAVAGPLFHGDIETYERRAEGRPQHSRAWPPAPFRGTIRVDDRGGASCQTSSRRLCSFSSLFLGGGGPGMAEGRMSLPVVRRFPETARRDHWWVQPTAVFLGLSALIGVSTWAAFQGEHYTFGPYLSPF